MKEKSSFCTDNGTNHLQRNTENLYDGDTFSRTMQLDIFTLWGNIPNNWLI